MDTSITEACFKLIFDYMLIVGMYIRVAVHKITQRCCVWLADGNCTILCCAWFHARFFQSCCDFLNNLNALKTHNNLRDTSTRRVTTVLHTICHVKAPPTWTIQSSLLKTLYDAYAAHTTLILLRNMSLLYSSVLVFNPFTDIVMTTHALLNTCTIPWKWKRSADEQSIWKFTYY